MMYPINCTVIEQPPKYCPNTSVQVLGVRTTVHLEGDLKRPPRRETPNSAQSVAGRAPASTASARSARSQFAPPTRQERGKTQGRRRDTHTHTVNERCHTYATYTGVYIDIYTYTYTRTSITHVIARTYRVLLSLPDLQKEQSVRAAKQTVVARQRPSQVPVAVQSVRATKQSGMRFVPAPLPSADRLGTQAFTQRSTHVSPSPHTLTKRNHAYPVHHPTRTE